MGLFHPSTAALGCRRPELQTGQSCSLPIPFMQPAFSPGPVRGQHFQIGLFRILMSSDQDARPLYCGSPAEWRKSSGTCFSIRPIIFGLQISIHLTLKKWSLLSRRLRFVRDRSPPYQASSLFLHHLQCLSSVSSFLYSSFSALTMDIGDLFFYKTAMDTFLSWYPFPVDWIKWQT